MIIRIVRTVKAVPVRTAKYGLYGLENIGRVLPLGTKEKDWKEVDDLKEYNPQKPREYHLEQSLYLRVLHTVRDYPRMIEKVNEVLYGGGNNDGMPKSNDVGKPTEKKAIAIAETQDTLNAIENALKQVPIEYRQYIFEDVVYKTAYPLDYADKSTWRRNRMKFLYNVANNLKLLTLSLKSSIVKKRVKCIVEI